MSKETRRLSVFSTISGKRKTPIAALILILIVMAGFALIRDIETIARLATVFIFLTFIAVNLCVIVLRFKNKSLKRAYKVPFSLGNVPVISALGVLLTAALLVVTVYSFVTGGATE